MSDEVRIGLIGCGAMGQGHVDVWLRTPGARIAAVCDPVKSRAAEMGRILSCSAYVKWWRAQSYYGSGGWRGTWELDGGVLANQAIHAIDHLCWLAGPVAEVEYAHLSTASHEIQAEDFAIAALR